MHVVDANTSGSPSSPRSATAAPRDLDTLVAKVQGQEAEIESEILVLQKKIQSLQQKKRQSQAFTSHCTNLKAPISRLPAESLVEIFSLVLPETGVNIGWRKSPPEDKPDIFQLGLVCYSWRKFLLSQPLFWSRVALSLPHPEASISTRAINSMYMMMLTRLNLCYRRSGYTLMSLIMNTAGSPPPGHERDLKVLFGRIAFGARRWWKIQVIGRLFEMPYQLGEVGYPNLRFLNLSDTSGDFLVVNRNLVNQNLQIFGQKAPNLTSVHLGLFRRHGQEFNTFYETSFLPVISPQITDYAITICGAFWLSDVAHLQGLSFLFSNLSTLKIHVLASSWRPIPTFTLPQEDILLPNLTSLDIRWGATAELFSDVFFRFILPGLRHLRLEVNGLQDTSRDLREWIKPFSASLRSADLRWDFWQSSLLIVSPLLQGLLGLSELGLRGPGLGRLFAILEARGPTSRFEHVPSLASLALHLRPDTKAQFLELISARTLDVYNDNTSTTSQLKHVKIHATQQLILDTQPVLSSLVERTNYIFSVEYEVDHEPWLHLGLDGFDSQPGTLSHNFS